MKTKKSTSITIATCAVVFTLLYIIFAATPLSKEYQFEPTWNLNLAAPASQNIDDNAIISSFSLGQSAGYFTNDGKISLYKSFPSRITISDHYYAIYNTEASNIPFYDNKGNKAGVIEGSGFPYICDDRIYLMLPGGGSYSLCNSDGSTKWTCENIITLTAFSSNKHYTISGYANGVVKVLNNYDGDTEFTFVPGGSDYSVIYGADVSENGQYIATLSGQDKQRFMITQRIKDQTKVIFHEYLDNELNRRTLVRFSKDGNRVFYNYKGGLGIYDLKRNNTLNLPLSDKIIAFEESHNLLFVLGQNENIFTVYIVEKTNTFEGSFSFEANNAFIKAMDDALYVGKDNSISKITLKRD